MVDIASQTCDAGIGYVVGKSRCSASRPLVKSLMPRQELLNPLPNRVKLVSQPHQLLAIGNGKSSLLYGTLGVRPSLRDPTVPPLSMQGGSLGPGHGGRRAPVFEPW